MDPYPQSGRVLPLRSMGGHRLAATSAERGAIRPAAVAALPDGVSHSPAATWQALAPAEQEGLVALMGDLSLRVVRATESGEDHGRTDLEDQR